MYEWQHQADLVRWFRYYYPQYIIYHIPNGEMRSGQTAKKLKEMGVLKGVYDLYIMDLRLYVEMKRSKRDKLSSSQQDFRLRALKTGHSCIEAYGFKDGVRKIIHFMASHQH